MNFESVDKWFAIQAKTNQEDIAAFNLLRVGLQVFNPKLKQEKIVWGCPKTILKPLFPGYLFAKFNPAKYLHIIQYMRGVRQILRFGMSLLPVDEEIIQNIRLRLNSDGYFQLQNESLVVGTSVFIHNGPLSGLKGIFERETSDRKRVVILLDVMGVHARVVMGKQFLKASI